MSSVDSRVVKMTFDNGQFESGVKQTLTSLEALSKGLKLDGATKGLEQVGAASGGLLSHLGPLGSVISSIADKFKATSIIAITALANIANRAVDAGLSLAKSFTLQPIIDGFHEYETNIGSIQTILANTGLEGAKGLQQVNDALNELNIYSDKTIYNFTEMARNIGTFTAAGVDLKTATEAIKGIANLAALSGSNAQQASTAMYQLSQAIAAGKVTLEDWNSVVNAGLGGKVFQNALIETARVHGVAIDQMIKDEGSFRLTLQKGWLTSSILTETLQKFTGDLTASQLKAMGYNDQQIAQILKMAQTAQDAATKIKTFSQLISTLQEAAGSGWTNTWQILFGNFTEAETLFTNVSNVLGNFINASAKTRNSVLQDWKDLGGRTAIIDAISNAFQALISIITPIGQAFRQIFPATTGQQLANLSFAIRDFTAGLKIGGKTADELRRTFAGVFAVFGIGWDIIKEVAKTLFNLFGIASQGSGSFLEVTAKIGDFLVALRQAIHDGTALGSFFKGLGAILAVPIKILLLLGQAIAKVFEKFDGASAEKSVAGFAAKFDPVAKLAGAIITAWSKVPDLLAKVGKVFFPMAQKFADFFSKLGAAISGALSKLNLDSVLKVVDTGLFAALIAGLLSFIKQLKSGAGSAEGLLSTITEPFEQLTNTLKSMQSTLQAATLLEIAVAVAALTLSVIGLSKIDSAGLTRALTAMTAMFTQLFVSMTLFQKVGSTKSAFKLDILAAGLILLAVAVDILTVAVKNLSTLSWADLAKGLTGLVVILGALVATVQLMPNDAKMLSTSVAMIALAAAVQILVSAVTQLAGLSWQDLAKGLIGVGAVLTELTLFTKFADADKGGLLQGAGILLLAAGVKVLASAVAQFGQMSWAEIGKGLTAMAGGLTVVAAALDIIPPTSLFSAAAVLIVAASLSLIGDAMKQMGDLSWGEIGKGITELAGALTLISAALILIPPTSIFSAAAIFIAAASLSMMVDALKEMASMSWSDIGKSLVELAGALAIITVALIALDVAVPGAVALAIITASLLLLAPVLQTFGDMSLEEIGKSLLELAGVFAVLGVAGLLLAPIVPILIGLGVAVTLLGIGILAAGAGVLLFATGLTALSLAGGAATIALVAMVSALAGLIPLVLTQVANGLIAFAQIIGQAGPVITQAFVTILNSLIDATVTLSPKIINALFVLLTALLNTMLKYVPNMVSAGLKLLTGVLNGIANNIGGVVTAATNVVVNFINAMSANQGRIIQSGVDFIISFINGLASAVKNNSAAMGQAGGNLATAIVEGMINGLAAGAGKIASEAASVAKNALAAAANILGIKSPSKEFHKLGEHSDQGFADGFEAMAHVVAKSAAGVGQKALETLSGSMSGISDIVVGEIDVRPTITPVLDLSNVTKNAGQIDKVLAGARSIDLTGGTVKAQNASAGFQSNQDQTNELLSAGAGTTINYTQNNTSPKALSTADIYRQTKNQLSKKKGDVTT